MIALQRALILIVAFEFLIGGWGLVNRLRAPAPPRPDDRGLDSLTRADLDAARRAAEHGDAAAWRRLAQGYLGQGFYVEAEQCFRVSCELDPEEQESVYGLGFCLERVGRLEPAIETLEQAAGMSQDELARTCWYQVGRCRLRLDQPAEAEEAFHRAGELPAAQYQIAKLMVRDGRAAEGASILDALLEANRASHRLLLLRARAAEALGDDRAAGLLRLRAESAPAGLDVDYGMTFIIMYRAQFGIDRKLTACTGFKQSQPAFHLSCLESAITLVEAERLPQYESVYLAAAEAALAAQDPQRADQLLKGHAALGESADPAAIEYRGDVAMLQGDAAAAQSAWERAAALAPSVTAPLKLAELAAQRGDADQAQALRAAAHELAGISACAAGRLDEAEAELRAALAVGGESPVRYYWLGVVQLGQDRLPDAAESLARAAALAPGWTRAAAAAELLRDPPAL